MAGPTPKLFLKPNRERRLENFHPWVFKDDVERFEGDPKPGEVGEILASNGAFIGTGYINARASIPARILSFKREAIHLDFYRKTIRKALEKRGAALSNGPGLNGLGNTNAQRVINSESDGLPGVIADQFADFLSVQYRNAGTERHRELISEALKLETKATSAFERSDTGERSKEGLESHVGVLWGEVPNQIDFLEDDIRFRFSPTDGQKTGFYLDQRDNRRRMASMVDASSRLLDVYSYTGGFSLHAAAKGATALAIDKDPVALAALEKAASLNQLEKKIALRLGDALEVLDQLVKENRKYTHAIIDPPTLAKRKDEVVAAKRIFTIASKNVLKMLEPGGILMVSTCAYHIKLDDLLEAVRFAGADAKRRLEVLDVTFQPADHPWILQVPESLYLKTLILRAE
jgi:23S rRNA (cytosine1962-C5)-methyltransferase